MIRTFSKFFIVFTLCWVNCDCQCEFPIELRGSWISSDHGDVEFNSTSVTGYAIPSDICKNACPRTLQCFENSSSLYLLRSRTFISGGVPLRMYVCWDMTEISYSKVIYYPAIQDINTFTNDRAVFLGVNFTDMASVCNRIKPYPPQSYNVFIKKESQLGSVSVCPNVILGKYKEEVTECSVELDSCTEKTSISITSSSCLSSALFIGNGTAYCIYSTVFENMTFLTVYNENVDNINTFQFTCLAIQMISGKLLVSGNPLVCFDNQTALVAPTTKGRVYEFIPSELCPITNSTIDNPLTVLSTAEITGLLLGLLLLLLLVIILICCCCCLGKCRKKHKEFDLEKEGQSRHESDEVRLLRAKKGGKLPDDTLSTDSGVGVYKDGSGLHNDGSDLSGEGNSRTNKSRENGDMISREGSDIYKDINPENTTLPKLLTSTRYGKNRKLVVDKYGRQILVDSGDDGENSEYESPDKRINSARSSISRRSNRSVGIHGESSLQLNDETDNSHFSRKTRKVKRLLPDGTEIEEEITDDEVDLNEELDEAGCKRENSFYVFQPRVPISGRLTTRRKEEKRNQVEKPRKTRKGFFKSLARKFKEEDYLSEDGREVRRETMKKNSILPAGVTKGDFRDNRTPYMEEYYYKKAMEQYLEDEGFFEDPDSKRRARDVFNFNIEGNPLSNQTNKISSKSVNKNTEQPNARSTPLTSRRRSKDSLQGGGTSGNRHENFGFLLNENIDSEDISKSNRETEPTRVRKHGIVGRLTPARGIADASDIRSSTPDDDMIDLSTNSIQKRNQGRVVFVENCSNSEKSAMSKKPISSKFPRLPDLHLPPVKVRKTSQNSVSSWVSGLYEGIHPHNDSLMRHPGSGNSVSPTSGMKTKIRQEQLNEKRKSQQSDLSEINGSHRKTCQSADSLDTSRDESALSHHTDIDCPSWLSKGKSHRAFLVDKNKKMEEQSSLFLRVPRSNSGRYLDGLLSPRNDPERKRKLTTSSLDDWYISVTPTSARLNYPVAEKDKMKKLLEELYLDKKYLNRLTDQTVDAENESERTVNQMSADCSDYLLKVAHYWEQHPPLPPIPPVTQIGFKLQRATTTLPERQHFQPIYIKSPPRSKSTF